MVNVLGIVAIVLAIIIVYFFIRLRQMMKNAPGATNKMNTLELIKNWQEQKSRENEYQNQLKQQAREAAKPEVEKIMMEKYKQEEIAKMTADPKDKLKQNLKSGLGLDADKIFSQDRIDRMVGRQTNVGGNMAGQVGNTDQMFSQERIDRMAGSNNISQDRIRQASGSLNWGEGVRQGLNSDAKFSGLDRALGREPPRRRYGPPRP